MCGICGFIGEVDDSKKVLKQMMDKIAHRGPDDEGMYVDKHAAIGHRRLSIIDLSHGAQPMYNETGDVAIVFNGEIYNHLEIKKGTYSKVTSLPMIQIQNVLFTDMKNMEQICYLS